MKKRFSFTEDTKWIAIGGSYAGSLAVWLRMKYPHLIYGVVSSSAPLLAKLNFPGKFDILLPVPNMNIFIGLLKSYEEVQLDIQKFERFYCILCLIVVNFSNT